MENVRHDTYVEEARLGSLGRCTCGARNDKFTSLESANAWCDDHDYRAKRGHLNLSGPRNPTLKSLEAQYRANSENLVYSPEERLGWVVMAEEIKAEIDRQQGLKEQTRGQMALGFDTDLEGGS